MGRPEYDDSVAGSDLDAADDAPTSLGTVYFGANDDHGINVGRLTEDARGNLGMLRHSDKEDDDGQA